MIQIILFKLGFTKNYVIEYNNLLHNSSNKTIDFFYYKYCPEPILKIKALEYIKNKIQVCVSGVVYIEKIGDIEYRKQFVF